SRARFSEHGVSGWWRASRTKTTIGSSCLLLLFLPPLPQRPPYGAGDSARLTFLSPRLLGLVGPATPSHTPNGFVVTGDRARDRGGIPGCHDPPNEVPSSRCRGGLRLRLVSERACSHKLPA